MKTKYHCFSFLLLVSNFFILFNINAFAFTDEPLVVRNGTYLISTKINKINKKHIRLHYAPIGMIVYPKGDSFVLKNENKEYRDEEYLPVLTESGITGVSILNDCLFPLKNSKLVVPQHKTKKLSIFFQSGNTIVFSRSDGNFAEVISYNNDSKEVIFPYYIHKKFNLHCGLCVKSDDQKYEGIILEDEMRDERAKLIDFDYYKNHHPMIFKKINLDNTDLLSKYLKCFNNEIFPMIDSKLVAKIISKGKAVVDWLLLCNSSLDADIAARTEVFGAGGGLSFSYNLKPKNRALEISLFKTNHNTWGLRRSYLLIKCMKCDEGLPSGLVKLSIIDLAKMKSFNLLSNELVRGTNLKYMSRGDRKSRRCMVTIGEKTGYDDVSDISNFLMASDNFLEFISLSDNEYKCDQTLSRTYIDFIIGQIADFRRPN